MSRVAQRIVCLTSETVEVLYALGEEQRIVGIGMPHAPDLQSLEPLFHGGRRELEVVIRHVTVGARAAVADQSIRLPVEEGAEAARDRVTGLAAAVVAVVFRFEAGRPALRQQRRLDRAGSQQQGCRHDEEARDQ